MKAEQQRQEAKHKKQWEELVFKNETSLRELEQLQVSHAGRPVYSYDLGVKCTIFRCFLQFYASWPGQNYDFAVRQCMIFSFG